jgi:hypothetical protein
MSRRQVAALVGVAPYTFESGKLKGKRAAYNDARGCSQHQADKENRAIFLAGAKFVVRSLASANAPDGL